MCFYKALFKKVEIRIGYTVKISLRKCIEEVSNVRGTAICGESHQGFYGLTSCVLE